MHIVEIQPNDKQLIRDFISFPFQLYADCPQWVPPFRRDMRDVFNVEKNPFYLSSAAAFFLLKDESGRTLGRIAVLDDQPYNRKNNSRTAFFYFFEIVEDFSAAKALFTTAFEWAKARGLDSILGPKGFAALNGLGMLVKGFRHRPAFGIPYNLFYYPAFLERLGFQQERDLSSGYLNRESTIPEKVIVVSKKVQRRWGLRAENFQSRKDLRAVIPQIKELYNGSLVGTSGNAALTDEQISAMADQLIWFANPRLVKILYKDDKAVGFLLAYPDISEGLQRSKGKLLPLGWIHILRSYMQTKWVNINGAGIIEEYRGMGGTAILFEEMAKSIKSGKYTHADIVQVGVENERMQHELNSLGIDFYKTHRLYSRKI